MLFDEIRDDQTLFGAELVFNGPPPDPGVARKAAHVPHAGDLQKLICQTRDRPQSLSIEDAVGLVQDFECDNEVVLGNEAIFDLVERPHGLAVACEPDIQTRIEYLRPD